MGAILATSIYSRFGNGVVFNGSARNLESIGKIKGFNAFVRDFHPSFLEEEVLMGLNTPIRIGRVMVLPGDLVLAKMEGILFIPAHLAEQVVGTAEFGRLWFPNGKFQTTYHGRDRQPVDGQGQG